VEPVSHVDSGEKYVGKGEPYGFGGTLAFTVASGHGAGMKLSPMQAGLLGG
jgi:hypothetical protein